MEYLNQLLETRQHHRDVFHLQFYRILKNLKPHEWDFFCLLLDYFAEDIKANASFYTEVLNKNLLQFFLLFKRNRVLGTYLTELLERVSQFQVVFNYKTIQMLQYMKKNTSSRTEGYWLYSKLIHQLFTLLDGIRGEMRKTQYHPPDAGDISWVDTYFSS